MLCTQILEVALHMKNFKSLIKKYYKHIFIYPIVLVSLFFASCYSLNFLLVPAKYSSTIETIFYDIQTQDKNIDCVFLGSSRTYRGIDSIELSKTLNKNVFNIAYETANYSGLYYVLCELINTHDIESLYLEASISDFLRDTTNEDLSVYRVLSEENKQTFADELDLKIINSSIFEFTNYMQNFSNEKFLFNIKGKVVNSDKLGDSINTITSTYISNGYMSSYDCLDENDVVSLPGSYIKNGGLWEEDCSTEMQAYYFEEIINLCKENNINIQLFSCPYPSKILTDNVEGFQNFYEFIHAYSEEYNINMLDFSLLKKDIFENTNQYFFDSNHCSSYGATALYPIITDIINDLESNTLDTSDYFYSSFQELYDEYAQQV